MAKYFGYILFVFCVLVVIIIWPKPEKIIEVTTNTDTIYLPGHTVQLPGKTYKVPYPVYYPLPGGEVDSNYILKPTDTTHQDSIITENLCFWYDISLQHGYLSGFKSKYLVNEKIIRETKTITIKPEPDTWHIAAGSFIGYKVAGVTLQYQTKKKLSLQYQYDIYNNSHFAGFLYRLR